MVRPCLVICKFGLFEQGGYSTDSLMWMFLQDDSPVMVFYSFLLAVQVAKFLSQGLQFTKMSGLVLYLPSIC